MPAHEETYRNLRAMHIVFSVSSILMFLSIIWMMAYDHYREWKDVQRDFARLDAAKAKRDTQVASEEELEDLRNKRQDAEEEAESNIGNLPRTIRQLRGKFQGIDQEYGFRRADRDSIASLYAIAEENGRHDEAEKYLSELRDLDEKLEALRDQWERANQDLQDAENQLKRVNNEVDRIQLDITEKQKEIDLLKRKQWTFSSAIRSLPVLDAFASATKIQQVVPEELTIDYSFRPVPRFDRCITCHQAIDTVTRDGAPAFTAEVIQEISGSNKRLARSKYLQAFKTHSRPELFAGATSPHPKQTFGCTICHEGQGSGTSFVFASHSPDSVEEEKRWHDEFGWYDVHFWEHKMLRARFVEASCVKCHPHVVDLEHSPFGNAAPKLVRGYHLVRQYGCFGCHEISGYQEGRLIGPDLRLEPQTPEEWAKAKEDPANPPGTMRKVGPSLRRIAEKVLHESWTERWIKLPKGFRPSTRMPQFYGLTNNDGKHHGSDEEDPIRADAQKDPTRGDVEVRAITHYLYHQSREYLEEVERIRGLDAAEYDQQANRLTELEAKSSDRSQNLSAEEQKEFEALRSQVPLRNVRLLHEPPVPIDPNHTTQTERGRELFFERGCLACHAHKAVPPEEYPQATQDFGPDLSNMAVKLRDTEGRPNTKWLFNWLRDPTVYHARAFMPNLQLSDQEIADIAAWLLSVEGEWAEEVPDPQVEDEVLDELVGRHLRKSMTLSETDKIIAEGISQEKLANIKGDERVLAAPIDRDKKLAYLGQKTIARLGCFGCHDIPGFETAKPIGVAFNNWGQKARLDPEKLEFGHIVEFLEEEVPEEQRDADFKLFFEGIKHHRGESFLWQKLRGPRSYDYKTLRGWNDRLRMPRFPFADNPEEVEAVMTFILGLVADSSIPAHLRNLPAGPVLAKVEGAKLLTKYNCVGCHVVRMPKFVFDPGKVELQPPNYRNEFPEVIQAQLAYVRDPDVPGTNYVGVHAMLVDPTEELPMLSVPKELPDDAFFALQFWEPVSINGATYLTGSQVTFEFESLEALNLTKSQPAWGGQFAELLAEYLPRPPAKTARDMWSRVPPPLIREGARVQPGWLHQFLLDPIRIRPGVVLRMPKFNMTSGEAAAIAAYFAAVDGVEYPYEFIAQRDETYLSRKDEQHPNYLRGGWSLLTLQARQAGETQLCANCHSVGPVVVPNVPEANGPDLWLTPDRLRPEWLLQWLASPQKVVPYTGMPQNFPRGQVEYQDYLRGSSFEQITAVRDALINYHRIQQDQSVKPQVARTPAGGN